ncbi:hypothetical protein GYO_4040 [Bacillus spizizenii TU-B-10]|uniref:Uncharacterized protein n=1 Tax=Bacillus spizizenii (strain DSM 15029 / JCM 12233 / NBRC 101239 / NRRL B-23049 / TU-B-10) TaxID=1052585 RepID=G4P1T1_BACS4|nr:hypothetical protein GYO_4040 [Bacillus spizizenii TU-B-10]
MYGFGIKISYNDSFLMPIFIYFGFCKYFLHLDVYKKSLSDSADKLFISY